MSFTTVPTISTSDNWTAANHNTYIKDNLQAIYDGRRAYMAEWVKTSVPQVITTGATTILHASGWYYDPDSRLVSPVTSGAIYRAAVAGYYSVFTRVYVTLGTWDAGEYLLLYLYKNDVLVQNIGSQYMPAGHSTFFWVTGTDVVQLAANDTIDVRVLQNSGGNVELYGLATIQRLQGVL